MRDRQSQHRVRPRRLTDLAWGGWLLCVGLSVANLWLLLVNWDTAAPGGFASGPVEVATGLGYAGLATVGLAMVVRRRDNGTGWVFLSAGVGLAFSGFASEYASYGVLTNPGALPAVPYVTWLGAWLWWVSASVALAFGLMLYPDGSLPSPQWRPVAAVAGAIVVVLGLLHAFAPGPLDGEFGMVDNPFGIGGADSLRSLRDVSWLPVGISAAITVAAVLAKMKGASPERRRQLLWVMVPAAVAVFTAPLWGFSARGEGGPSPAVRILVLLVVFGTPAAVASAHAHAATLRRSVDRLVLAREEERRRIRRDLHDGLGPTLAGVALQLDVARDIVRHDPDGAYAVLDGLAGLVNTGIADIRRLVDDLRPPVLDQLGLVAAIREGTSYLNQRGSTGELSVVVETAGNVAGLAPATEVTAFRIVMEAVTHASRHGRASRCVVHLAVDGALEVRVEDDGCGLAEDHLAGVGLSSMQERAAELGGTCAVEPGPDGGTVVRARLPTGGAA